ncbi:hypothetical protein [Megamonas hypermegale]|uniref:hypothetical protein n=1 Tax=Megamonas hypermegale TaxID=158847 RepID=UPI0026F00C88|nr:hypothetical protein [Megamonas hypermegale]
MNIKLKSIIFIAILFIIPANCFANYFTDNPNRYINTFNSEQFSEYTDLNSVNVVRYYPPYYVIDITVYVIDYFNQHTLAVIERFYYNYDQQTMRLKMIKVADASAENGTSQLDNTKPMPETAYTIDTMPIVKKYSSEYLVGEIAFMKAYRMFFTKEYNR